MEKNRNVMLAHFHALRFFPERPDHSLFIVHKQFRLYVYNRTSEVCVSTDGSSLRWHHSDVKQLSIQGLASHRKCYTEKERYLRTAARRVKQPSIIDDVYRWGSSVQMSRERSGAFEASRTRRQQRRRNPTRCDICKLITARTHARTRFVLRWPNKHWRRFVAKSSPPKT